MVYMAMRLLIIQLNTLPLLIHIHNNYFPLNKKERKKINQPTCHYIPPHVLTFCHYHSSKSTVICIFFLTSKQVSDVLEKKKKKKKKKTVG